MIFKKGADMEPVKQHYKNLSENLIREFSKRNIECKYFEDSRMLIDYLKTILPENAVVSWGGSMTLNETGVSDFLKSGKFKALDRAKASGPEEQHKIYREALSADYYFMSSNAVTMDGKLVNIDATGNRVAALCYGPDYVIVIAGMNKIVRDEEAAISRIKNYACPVNAIRISRNTPCSKTGKCSDCLGNTICSHTVVTRNVYPEGRIKLFLVGDSFGY